MLLTVMMGVSLGGVGAIAVRPDGKTGYVMDQQTKAEAERIAMERCGRTCKVLVVFRGPTCGAIAMGGETITWGNASSQKKSEALALNECRDQEAGCSLLMSTCNFQGENSGTWKPGAAAQPPASPPTRPPPSAKPKPLPITPETIQACEGHFTGTTNEQACLGVAAGFFVPPAPAIKACDDHFSGDTNALACLEATAPFVTQAAPVIRACDDHFSGDTNAMLCLKAAAPIGGASAELIKACDDHFSGDTNAMRCMAAAEPLKARGPGIVRACDDSSMGDENALKCISMSVPQ